MPLDLHGGILSHTITNVWAGAVYIDSDSAKTWKETLHTNHVAQVNRKFYDAIAPVYERIDSRRRGSPSPDFLDRVLGYIKSQIPETEKALFLDAGAGSGFLAQRATNFFRNIILLDISQEMLKQIRTGEMIKLQGDCSRIALAGQSVDVVGAFATLHHLYNPEEFLQEAHRILKPGGILYCDHDIEQQFVTRFKYPLRLYRLFCDHGHGYLRACPALTKSEYKLTEFHGDTGLDGRKLVQELERLGFEILCEKYHWEGMGPVADLLDFFGLSRRLEARGSAPVVRFIARKL